MYVRSARKVTRVCNYCGKEFIGDKARYCDAVCAAGKRQQRMADRRLPQPPALCRYCGTEFVPHKTLAATLTVYCNDTCRKRHYNLLHPKSERGNYVEGTLPAIDDGEDSDLPLLPVPPKREEYEGTCNLCSYHAYVWWDDTEARKARPQRCPQCTYGKLFYECVPRVASTEMGRIVRELKYGWTNQQKATAV